MECAGEDGNCEKKERFSLKLYNCMFRFNEHTFRPLILIYLLSVVKSIDRDLSQIN